jgi:DNA-binding winged helix-turn-helix (wHTH) protein/Flp pilus assembly protein TadD
MSLIEKEMYRFGPFSLDPTERVVSRDGTRLSLTPKVFDTLVCLVRNHGRLLTKDELLKEVWPDTFVEEVNLAVNVSTLRKMLGEGPQEGRYIVTVAGRGYRFVAAVQKLTNEKGNERSTISDNGLIASSEVDLRTTEYGFEELDLQKTSGADHAVASTNRTDLQPLKGNTASGSSPAPSSAKVTSGGIRWIVAILAVLVIAVLGSRGYFHLHRKPKITEKDTVVLADFANSTGDPVFDDTLRTALSVSLNQSPFLNVLSYNKVVSTLKLMTHPPDTKLMPDIARELCIRAGSKAYIAGSIASLGSEYVIGVKAVNCQTGDTLAEQQVTADGKEKVLNRVGDAAAKLRGQLGESLASVQKYDVPLEQATTSSLEALQAYSTGVKINGEKGAAAALPHNQRAIELDPDFAMAYRALAGNYLGLLQLGRANQYFTRAFELREHASQREKLLIVEDYYHRVTGELEKAAQANQDTIDNYPRDRRAYLDLSQTYGSGGQYEQALKVAHQYQQLAPDNVGGYDQIANVTMALQRFDEARKAIQEARARKLDDYLLHVALYGLGFLGSDSQTISTEQRWFREDPAYENSGLSLDSDTEAYAGRIKKARELTKRAVNSAVRTDSKENGAIWWENAALREAAIGNVVEARSDVAAGLRLDPASPSVQVEAALTYALVGDASQAQPLMRDLNQRYPLSTQIQSLWLPSINAQIAIDRKDAAAAIEHLERAQLSIEFGNIPFINQASCLYPTYIRGQAFLAAGQGTQAAAEFQKTFDHSGIVWNCWTGALARLGVARANALQARTSQGADADAARVRALAAYKDFLALWKDADPDIPILKQAKTEYARLQ